ncbi:UbiA prenyltransferase family protein [Urechidicola croceus]|uniref:Prenyltransferase n=1 Tax=Urechidicola croceus TaxID=1850246 RepID=A0A1D8P6T0_9FLAO|nr:hypothetical protein [Urechidicola croceus]AOW20284.1 hypothetical protein LPB138_06150 [Urechidicola croceus]
MRLLKCFFNFYIYSNIHVALCVFCLVKITLLEYDLYENLTGLFSLFSTIVSYNFIRFYRILDIENWFTNWLNSNRKTLYTLTFISAIISGFLFLKLRFEAILWLIPFIGFTLFYAIPLPFKKIPLRKFGGVKLFLIAISWAGITVLFPLVENGIEIKLSEWLTFFQRFFFVILITIPFDIRDVHIDSKSLKTLPQTIGIKNSKIIGILFALLLFFTELVKTSTKYNSLTILFIVCVVSVVLLLNSKESQSKYYASFWVESIPILWFLLTILGLNL